MFHGKIVLKIEGDDDDSETHYYWRNRRIWGVARQVCRVPFWIISQMLVYL